MADITLVRLLASVYPEMSLEFEGVGTGVSTVGALVRSLSSMAPHVSLQFAQLHAGVVAFGALVGFLKRVDVPDMAY